MAEPKRVEVTLVGIRCINADDGPGDELEIYGTLYVKIESVDPNGGLKSEIVMWSAPDDDPEDIAEGNLFRINNTQIVTLKEDEQLALGGHLVDYDWPDENDDMDYEFVRVQYSEIEQDTREHHVPFSDAGQRISVEYTVHESPSS